ncbi:MAG: histidine kinase [Saprospiraceae bacterium]|nr:histidine kinase [Saprospiraceae bacterium]
MKNSHWIAVLLNFAFWIASAWLLVSGYSIVSMEYTVENGVESKIIERDTVLMLKIGGTIFLSLILFYVNLFFLSIRGSETLSGRTMLTSLAMLLAALLIFEVLTFIDWIPRYPEIPLSLTLGILGFYYAISCAYGLALSWLKSEEVKKNLILERNQAELSLLRYQLQPHFLFNALNNLLSLINEKQYRGASNAIEKLAHLLRYVVEENQGGKVKLLHEIEFIRNYTSLQMLRYHPGEVEVNLSVNGNTENREVEPGLFLPFVENAFKYGTQPEEYSRIDILFDATHTSELYFSVSNPDLKNKQEPGTGTGIAATRKRLDLVYPDKYLLEIEKNTNYVIRLKLMES